MLNIEPIKLLSGSHDDTGRTGSGCFMNVIAYLNGEPQITDQSPCVCHTIRRVAIWVNDFLTDAERHQLLPFVQRAMGTATDDRALLEKRVGILIDYIFDLAAMAQCFAPGTNPSKTAANALLLAEMAAKHSKSVSESGEYFADLATDAADAARECTRDESDRQEIIQRSLAFMEAICPPADEPTGVLIERANKLLELASAQGEL